MTTFTKNRRDTAEPHYVRIYREAGAIWHPLPRGCGCDGLLLLNFDVAIVEHKSREGERLTDDEQTLQERCIKSGVPYRIVDSEWAARALIGEMRGTNVVEEMA